ncbi:hypothetical protein B0T26DRAFT_717611 [Lasiosphaeria miniovina]|uniref:Secreted protein n=1 Tax=Lasiosphaeria miniovina TaxID=1954250 RepID=A0AA40ACR8_9PEZI|nr:uncharacterized protein B0T26DRAFT_717611 [Lasiosphaeria miniovina]KAK0713489.1 hypothetical protein B0T26DRAFT_717611 [Lasiosphaeria miniovina]
MCATTGLLCSCLQFLVVSLLQSTLFSGPVPVRLDLYLFLFSVHHVDFEPLRAGLREYSCSSNGTRQESVVGWKTQISVAVDGMIER